MLDFVQARRNMIDSQIRPCDVNDPLLLQAVRAVPRERFVAPGREAFAYIDQNITISDASDRRMLNAMVLSRMLQALEILPGEKILDVACGYGYTAAILAEIGASVIALEDDEAIAAGARERLADRNGVSVVTGDLSQGAPQHAPFDAIIVNGAVEIYPETLLSQLKDGGRLIAVHRDGRVSRAVLHTRSGEAFGKREIIDANVPVLQAFHKDSAFVF